MRTYLIWARMAYVSGGKVNMFFWGECLILIKSWTFCVGRWIRAMRRGTHGGSAGGEGFIAKKHMSMWGMDICFLGDRM